MVPIDCPVIECIFPATGKIVTPAQGSGAGGGAGAGSDFLQAATEHASKMISNE